MVIAVPAGVRDRPPHTRNMMSSQERRHVLLQGIDIIIDGGANCGQYAMWMRECGFGGTIVSFEPASEAFAVLAHEARRDSSWVCRQEALGSEDGEATLNLTLTSLGSSILRRTRLHAEMWPEDLDAGTETVPVRCLRRLWGELGCEGKRVFLKLDVEGAELSVLKGAGPVLAQIELLELEIPLVRLHHDSPTLTEMLNFLDGQGFSTVALEQNHKGDEVTGQMLMLDGIFRQSLGAS